jgi:hypothetical protein
MLLLPIGLGLGIRPSHGVEALEEMTVVGRAFALEIKGDALLVAPQEEWSDATRHVAAISRP